jgi:hypothetical protein
VSEVTGRNAPSPSVKAAYHSPHSRLCQPEINVYLYPELRHLRQETSDTVVTPSIPDMTLAVVELNDSAKRVSYINATAAVAQAHCKKTGNMHDALLKN